MRKVLIYLLILTGTYGFGLFDRIISISTPFGVLTESIIVLFVLIFYDFFTKDGYKKKYIDSVLFPVFLLVVFFIVVSLRNVLFDGVTISKILREFRRVYSLALIFPIINTNYSQKDLLKIIKVIIFFGFIGGIVNILQFILGDTLVETSFSRIDFDTKYYRSFSFAMWFVGIATFFSLSFVYHIKLNKKYILFSLVMILSIVLTVTRSFIVAFVITSLLNLVFTYNVSKKKLYSIILGSIISISIIFFIVNSYIFKLNIMLARFTDAIFDLGGYEYGSGSLRFEMMGVKINAVLSNSPLLGRGFNITEIDQGFNMSNYFAPYALNGDATYQNIFIYSGIIGIIVFILWMIYIYRYSVNIYSETKDFTIKIITASTIGMPLYFIILGFFGNWYDVNGFTILMLVTGLIYHADRLKDK